MMMSDQAAVLFRFLDESPELLLDVGVADGTEAQTFKRRWPDLQVIGLEPCPQWYRQRIDDYPGTLLPLAAWSEETQLNLYCPDDLRRTSVLKFRDECPPMLEPIPARTLDSLDRELGPWKSLILWADIEGSELRMLQGATELLKSQRIVAINLEVRPVPDWIGGCTETEVDEFLARFGYEKVISYCPHPTHHDAVYLPKKEPSP